MKLRDRNWSGRKSIMIVVEHPRPCILSPPEVAATILVNLRPFRGGGNSRYERLIVVRSPEGNYVVACLPFFTYGILFGDLVELEERGKEFNRVLKHSGLRTLRFRFKDLQFACEVHGELQGKLVASGLPHEWYGVGYLAVLLRSVTDQVSDRIGEVR